LAFAIRTSVAIDTPSAASHDEGEFLSQCPALVHRSGVGPSLRLPLALNWNWQQHSFLSFPFRSIQFNFTG
jgi:hypothetical protein